jgi:hypothetical protein
LQKKKAEKGFWYEEIPFSRDRQRIYAFLHPQFITIF